MNGGGFYLSLSNPAVIPWSDKRVLVVVKNNAVELKLYGTGGAAEELETSCSTFADGQLHEVTFGLYDYNTTDIRVVLTVDGETLFDVIREDSTLLNAEYYFNTIASPSNGDTIPWVDKGILVCIKGNGVELQAYGASHSGIIKKASTKLDTGKVLFRPGWTYDVTFGMVDVNNDVVRIIMTVDGTEVFNEVVEDSALVGAQTCFGLITSGGATLTFNGAGNEEHFDKYDTVTVDAMLAETTGWKDFTWADPSFGGASVPVDGVATVANSENNYKHITYTKTAYKDAQFHFQYTVNNTKEEFSQRFFVENASDPYYYVGPGVYVQFFTNKTVFYVTGAGGTVVASATDNAKKLVSGQEYTMDLSVYTVDADANNVRVVLKVDDAVWYDGCNRRERSSGNQFLLLRCTGKIVHCYRESCVVETRQHRAWDKPKPGLALQPRFLPTHLQKRCAHRNGDAPLRIAIKLFCSIIRSADDTHLSYGVVHCPGAGCVNLPDENAVAFR